MNLSLPHDADVTMKRLSLKDLQRKDSPYISDIDDLEYSKSIIADKNNDKITNSKKLSLQLDLSKLHTNTEHQQNHPNNLYNAISKTDNKSAYGKNDFLKVKNVKGVQKTTSSHFSV